MRAIVALVLAGLLVVHGAQASPARNTAIAEIHDHIAHFTSEGDQTAADRWRSVLSRLNNNPGIKDPALQSWLADANAHGWTRGQQTLPKVIAILAADNVVLEGVDAGLVARLRGYAAETHEGQTHVDRWRRALAALGENNGYTPMTVAQAQALADQGWQRWVEVVEALKPPQEPPDTEVEPPDTGVEPRSPRYAASCRGGDMRVQEDANGVYVLTVKEDLEVHEGAPCVFDNPGLWPNHQRFAFVKPGYVKPNNGENLYYLNLPGLTNSRRSGVQIDWHGSGRMAISTGSYTQRAYNDDVYRENWCGPVFKFLEVGTNLKFCLEDNDPRPAVTSVLEFDGAAGSAAENQGPLQPVITLTPPPSGPVTVELSVSGTARKGTLNAQGNGCTDGDFCFRSPVVIPADTSRYTLPVHLRDNDGTEEDETVTLTLDAAAITGNADHTVGATSAWTGTIVNVDSPPVADRRSARQCVEARLGAGEGCGPGGNRITLERVTAGPVVEGATLTYYAYPSFPPTSGDVEIMVEMTGRTLSRRGREWTQQPRHASYSIPKEGAMLTVTVPSNSVPDDDGDIHLVWKVKGETSTYTIHADHTTDTVRITDDDDDATWYYINETMGNGLTEGTHVPRDAKIAIDSRTTGFLLDGSNTLEVDFNVTGCALQSSPITASTPVAGTSDMIPCYIDIPASGGSNDAIDIHRVEEDKFELRKVDIRRWRSVGFTFSVGDDADTAPETISFAPQVKLAGRDGDWTEDATARFPETLTVYDDDRDEYSESSWKEYVYLLAASQPDTPTGGRNEEHHVPTGWSLAQLQPTATEDVYQSERSPSYSGERFNTATAWKLPRKVADRIAAEIVVTWRRPSFSVNENNGPAQPTLTYSGAPTRDYVIPFTITSSTATLGGDYTDATGSFTILGGSVPRGRTASVLNTRIKLVVDDVYEPDEVMTLTFGDLPPGAEIGVVTNCVIDSDSTMQPRPLLPCPSLNSATVTIIDHLPDPNAPPPPPGPTLAESTPDGTIRLLGVKEDFINESVTSMPITLRLWAKTAYTGALEYTLEDDGVAGNGRLANSVTRTIDAVTLAAETETEVSVDLHGAVAVRGAEEVFGNPAPYDEPDGRIAVKLLSRAAIDGTPPTPGYDIDGNDLDTVVVRDVNRTLLYMERNEQAQANDSRVGDNADFAIRMYDESKSNVSAQPRALLQGEIVEFPIRVHRKEGQGSDLLPAKGETISPDDYVISAHGQSNVTITKMADGYKVKIVGGDSADAPCSTTANDGTTVVGTKSTVACLNFHGKLPQRDGGWGSNGVEDQQTLYILVEVEGDFGATNVSGGLEGSAAGDVAPGRIDVNRLSENTTNRAFTINPVNAVSVREPTTGYAWMAFDAISTGPITSATQKIAFCVDSDATTASYYHDYTIYSEGDHALVSRYPRYGRYVTGYAWRANDQCSKPLTYHSNSERFWIRVLPDSHDEGSESIRLRIEQRDPKPDGLAIASSEYVTFTIVNDGPIPAAWLARFGRTVGEHAVDGISARMAGDRMPGLQGAIAGQTLVIDPETGAGHTAIGSTGAHALAEIAQAFGTTEPGGIGPEAEQHVMTVGEVLLGSSFSLTGRTDGAGGTMGFWGRAAPSSFDGREGTLELDGTVTTGMLGADYARGDWLFGLALAQSKGDGGYRRSDEERTGDGTVDASLTSAIPYASLDVSQRLKLWSALGYGAGDVTLETAMGGRYRADTDWRMAAAGLQGDLLEAPTQGSGPALALTSDALWTRTASEKTRDLAASESDVTRLRLGLEGSWRMALDGGDAGAATGASLVPRLEVGARHDGGDAETGFGVELGGGLAWTDPALGLTLDVSGRTLLAHENDDLEDRGFAASLGFDPRPESERGPSFSLRQDFGGQASGGLDALFQPAPLDTGTLDEGSGSERTGAEATSRWTAQIAYGLPAFGGRWTGSPHAGLGLSPDTRDYTLGWRWTPAENAHPLTFGLKATRRESDGAAPEHALGFEASARW